MGALFSSVADWSQPEKIPRPCFVEGICNRGKVVYRQKVSHDSQKGPYKLEFSYPSSTITGIACCPVANEKIQSPEAAVTAGGVNCKYVHIYLEPLEEDEWAYELAISAEENL
jgi:hypothetical protein